MTSLPALQRIFQDDILRARRRILPHLAPPPRGDAVRRLGVYGDAYRSRLIEALGNDYPGLRGVMGARAFESLMREFVEATPSRHANLRWYGADLEQFMRRSKRWKRRPGLAELARFEWTLGLAFDAADAPLARAEDAARLPAARWPSMRLRLQPSVRLLSLRGNAPLRWQAASRGRRLPRAAMRKQARVWLIWRRGHTPRYRALPPDEARALDAVARGRSFAAVCAALRRDASAAARAAQLLRDWLAEGLIGSIK